MTLSLESLRRGSNPDLRDDVFGSPSTIEDWRSLVPSDVRTKWPEMSLSERFGVTILAHAIIKQRQHTSTAALGMLEAEGRE